MTSVAVAMATLDGERHLVAQLESIARQTLRPAELVVCDDGSTDGTLEILESFAAGAAFPVRVHRNERRLGVGDNFLLAASSCASPLVAFADQDDVWLEGKLARSARALEEPGVRLCIHACAVVDQELLPFGRAVPDIRRPRIAQPLEPPRWGQAPGMAMTFDRGLLELFPAERRPRAHHEHGRLLHDEWVYGLARLAGRIAFLPDQLVLYRQHGVNVEGAPGQGLRQRVRDVANAGWDYYRRRAEQARDWAQLLDGGPFAGEAAAWRRLAERLEARAEVYRPDAGRRARATSLARALSGGTYGPRSREGFGVRGLVRDATLVAMRE